MTKYTRKSPLRTFSNNAQTYDKKAQLTQPPSSKPEIAPFAPPTPKKH